MKLIIAALFTLVLLACSGEATPVPTGTPEPEPTPSAAATRPAPPAPTMTPTPTATPSPESAPPSTSAPVSTPSGAAPTNTPAPAATAVPPTQGTENEAGQFRIEGEGQLMAFAVDNAEAFTAALTQAEWECVADVVGSRDRTEVYERAAAADEQEIGMLTGCLGKEALVMMFQAELLEATGPLSAESSACIRDNLGSIPSHGYSFENLVEFIATQTAGFAVVVSCLNEDEWKSGPLNMGLGEYDPDGFACVVDKLGGPAGYGEAYAALQFGGGGTAVFDAHDACGVAFDSSGSDAPTLQDYPGPGEGEALAFYDGLDQGERDCMDSAGVGVTAIGMMLGHSQPIDERDVAAAVGCLGDEAVTVLFMMSLTGLPGGEVAGFAGCLSEEIPAERIRNVLAPPDGTRNPAEGLALGLEAQEVFSYCMTAGN